jgi:hypothetical protein
MKKIRYILGVLLVEAILAAAVAWMLLRDGLSARKEPPAGEALAYEDT